MQDELQSSREFEVVLENAFKEEESEVTLRQAFKLRWEGKCVILASTIRFHCKNARRRNEWEKFVSS